MLKINKNFQNKYYLNILNIVNFLHLFDNLICMIFIKFENKNKFQFLNINIFKKVGLIYCIKLKENLEKMVNKNKLFLNKLLINHNLMLILGFKFLIIVLNQVYMLFLLPNHKSNCWENKIWRSIKILMISLNRYNFYSNLSFNLEWVRKKRSKS